MRSGWFFDFKINRRLTKLEKVEHLRFKKKLNFNSHGGEGLIKFNSTYIEYLDRRFKDKGELFVLVVVAGALFMFLLACFFLNENLRSYTHGVFFDRVLTIVITLLIFGTGIFLGFL